MGTRHIVGTIHNDQLHGSYAQYDGYPTGTGAKLQGELRAFIGSVTDIELMWPHITALVAAMRYVDASDNPTPEEAEKYKNVSDLMVSTGRDWYATLREHHGSLMLPLGTGIATDQPDFIKNSLMCEWAYIFDCDLQKVYILRGFNTTRANEWPRAALSAEEAQEEIDKAVRQGFGPYYGCSLAWEGTLAAFISLDMGELEDSLSEADEEETTDAA